MGTTFFFQFFLLTALTHDVHALALFANVTTLAGGRPPYAFADGSGTNAYFESASGVAIDASGNIIVADSGSRRIRKVTPGGVTTTLAGSGSSMFANGVGTGASFISPYGVAVDSSGNVIVADSGNHRIRKVTPGGVVTTLAGSGSGTFADGTGAGASFNSPYGVAVDASGNAFVADFWNYCIRRVTPAGVVTSFAGRCGQSGSGNPTDGTGTSARFGTVSGVAIDANGTLFMAESTNNCIRKVTPGGVVTTLAGSAEGFADGTAAGAAFFSPSGIAVDASGNVFVCDTSNKRIRRVTPGGVVTTVAGNWISSLDNGIGTAASFAGPLGVTFDASGAALYVADDASIRKVAFAPCPPGFYCPSFTPIPCPAGAWSAASATNCAACLAGSYSAVVGASASTTCLPCAAPAASAAGWGVCCGVGYWASPAATACTPCAAGRYGASTPLASAASCSACAAGTYSPAVGANNASTCAACAAGSFSGAGAAFCTACPGGKYGSTAGATACLGNCTAGAACPGGATTFAGAGACPAGSYCAAGAPPTPCPAGVYGNASGLSSPACSGPCDAAPGAYCPPGSASPSSTAPCPAGSFCVGGGAAPAPCSAPAGFYCPAGAASTSAAVVCPAGAICRGGASLNVTCVPALACVLQGLSVQPPRAYTVATLAGGGARGNASGETNGVGTNALFSSPEGVAVDPKSGMVYVADTDTNLIRGIFHNGTVVTIAGSGVPGYANGIGTNAQFSAPKGVAVGPTGTVFVAISNSIRAIYPNRTVVTVAGGGSSGFISGFANGVGTNARFSGISSVAVDPSSEILYVSEFSRVRGIYPNKTVFALAGGGTSGSTRGWAGGVGIDADVGSGSIRSVSIDPSTGRVYVASFNSNTIYAIFLNNQSAVAYVAEKSQGAAVDPISGALFSSHYAGGGGGGYIAAIDPSRVLVKIAGGRPQDWTSGSTNGVGSIALFNKPSGLAVESSSGVIYVADTGNHQIRAMLPFSCPGSLFDFFGRGCLSPSPSPTRSSSRSPSTTVTPSRTPSASVTASATPSPTASISFGASPSATPSGTNTPTPTGSDTASPTATPTQTQTGAPTASDTPTGTPSSSDTPSPSASSSPSPSATPSLTPSATPTPPPFSCLARAEGCASPALLPAAPLSPSGAPLLPAPLLTASWPFISASAVFLLPLPPSPGEAALARCAALPAGSAAVSTVAGAPFPLCAPSAPGEACFTLPSAAFGANPPAANATLLLLPLPAPAPPPTSLSCTLYSSPLQPPDRANLPRYGASTTVALPLASAPPSTAHLLLSVWAESSVAKGAFRVVGGAGSGTRLPRLPPPELAAPPDNATASWSAPSVGGNASALAPLLALAASAATAGAAGSSPSSFPFSATLSSATHLLLVLSNASSPFGAASNATLNGVPCALNWVFGPLVSITTPPLSALCAYATSDCGDATLLLSTGADPAVALSSALSVGAPIPLPAAYPPLLPPLPAVAGSDHPAWGALVGLPLPALLSTAAALIPDGTGLHLAAACTDPTFAPPEFCALADGAPPPPPPNGTACAWGSGDACVPCPAEKALCPGGAVLLPRPGWWAPLRTSPPGDLLPCPEPGAAVRCPGGGSAGAGAGGCGAGFRGQACSGCAAGFFPSAGSCASCPRLSAALAQAAPVLSFAGALAGVGALLLGAAQAALSRGGRAPPPCGSPDGAPRAVVGLLAWTWTSAQGAAALFSQAVDAGLVPPTLLPAFSVLAALQFVGVTLSPACYTSTPFSGFWASVGLASGALLVLCAAAAALPRVRKGAPCARALAPLLRGAALLLSVGYGAYVNAAVTVLTCRLPAPMAVGEYARAASDGRALVAALGAAAPPLAALRAAAEDPFLAQRLGLAGVLRATIPVATLASDPFTVCREGAHAVAWPAAAACLILLVAVLPGVGLWALWGTGHLKGLRRALCAGGRGPAGVGGDGATTTTTPAALIAAALVDGSLRPPWAWLAFYQYCLTALCSGVVALTLRAASPTQFIALQALLIAAALGSAVLVAWARPHLPREQWRTPVQVALYLLAAASAAVNLTMRFAGEAAARGPLGWGLACSLLALAGATLLLLFGGWWRALVARSRKAAVTGGSSDGAGAATAAAAAVEASGGDGEFSVCNPLAAAPMPPPPSAKPLAMAQAVPPSLWARIESANGNAFLLNRGTGETAPADEPPGSDGGGGGGGGAAEGPSYAPAPGDTVLVLRQQVGVVRFVGPTLFAEGTWVGVELRRAAGRHDGEVLGVRYFSCAEPGPKRATFVRASEVAPFRDAAAAHADELCLSIRGGMGSGGALGMMIDRVEGAFVVTEVAPNSAALDSGVCVDDALLRFVAAAGAVEAADFGGDLWGLVRALARAPRPLQLSVTRPRTAAAAAAPPALTHFPMGPAIAGWLPVRHADGDEFWRCEATGELQWLHPADERVRDASAQGRAGPGLSMEPVGTLEANAAQGGAPVAAAPAEGQPTAAAAEGDLAPPEVEAPPPSSQAPAPQTEAVRSNAAAPQQAEAPAAVAALPAPYAKAPAAGAAPAPGAEGALPAPQPAAAPPPASAAAQPLPTEAAAPPPPPAPTAAASAPRVFELSIPPSRSGRAGAVFSLGAGGVFSAAAVTPGGAAEAGGLRVGDVLLRFRGVVGVVEARYVMSEEALARALGKAPRPLAITVARKGGGQGGAKEGFV
jgi:DNA-binding beta-propeller fold protein YncE